MMAIIDRSGYGTYATDSCSRPGTEFQQIARLLTCEVYSLHMRWSAENIHYVSMFNEQLLSCV